MLAQGIQSRCLIPSLKDCGCYFFDILRQVEIQQQLNLSEDDAMMWYYVARYKKFVEQDCTVIDPVGLANLVCGQNAYRVISKSDNKPDLSIYIVCGKKPMYTHFTLIENGKRWDSLDPNRPTADSYTPDSYRVLV